MGRAGEFFVAGHLLRRGLNPALLAVDGGVDLLAHREFKTADLLFAPRGARSSSVSNQDNCDERIPVILADKESPSPLVQSNQLGCSVLDE